MEHTAQGVSNGKKITNLYAMRWENATANHLSWLHFREKRENASQVELDKCSDRITQGLRPEIKNQYRLSQSINRQFKID